LKKPIPFGKYYLLERINIGGMAEVFKAKTFGVEGFERLIAVKRILPNIAEDEEFIAMFIDEAKIAVQLQHGNIAQIFDLGKVDDSYFIALEYVNGKDLRSIFDRLRGKGEVMPIQQACYVIMQVCEGLDYAHNKRDGQGRELHLVHRDISPQNVLIGYDGEVKLIDFGIAKAAGKASKTQAGILKGKFGYMSPEQVRGLPIDRRSDIFSVGIVLYELLTNERLFVGESDFSTLEKVRNVEIMPPSSYNKKIPQELERIVLRALAKDPEDRYSNAIDLHDDLQAFLYTVGEFYSRKDLAAWMKKVFASEIEEDKAKIDQYRQLAPPAAASKEVVQRRAAVAGGSSISAAAAAAAAAAAGGPRPGGGDGELNWDDEELDTQIFDKEPSGPNAVDETALFFEDDDRTVANDPPPEILEKARGSSVELLATPPPRVQQSTVRRTASTGARATLAGMQGSSLPSPVGRPSLGQTSAGLGGPPPGMVGAGTRRTTGFNVPAVPIPPPLASPPSFSFEQSHSQPGSYPPVPAFGAGTPFPPTAPIARPSARGGRYAALALLAIVVLGGGGAYWYYSMVNRPGRIQLTMVPADATVYIDKAKVGEHSPFSMDKPPGPYTLSVARDGYVRSDQNIELRAGQPLNLNVTLEPSQDTGFELTSDPPGGLVWLDGMPMTTPGGGQAKTNLRAYRTPPGHHLVEIKGETRFKPWQQDIEVQPGQIHKVHATLIPAGDTREASREASDSASKSNPPVAMNDPAAASVPAAGAGAGAGARRVAGAGPRRKRLRDRGDSPVASAPSGAADADGDDSKEPAREPQAKVAAAAVADTTGGDCTITIGSRPWSEVWIDGKNTNRHTPFADYKIACGKHKILFKRPDLQIERTETINVRPGEKFKQSFTLASDSE
jgi:hypothetical protein